MMVVNGVPLDLVGHCGYWDEESFSKGMPNGTGVALFCRKMDEDDVRVYLRVQQDFWDESLCDMDCAEKWYEVDAGKMIPVDIQKGFKRLK